MSTTTFFTTPDKAKRARLTLSGRPDGPIELIIETVSLHSSSGYVWIGDEDDSGNGCFTTLSRKEAIELRDMLTEALDQ